MLRRQSDVERGRQRPVEQYPSSCQVLTDSMKYFVRSFDAELRPTRLSRLIIPKHQAPQLNTLPLISTIFITSESSMWRPSRHAILLTRVENLNE